MRFVLGLFNLILVYTQLVFEKTARFVVCRLSECIQRCTVQHPSSSRDITLLKHTRCSLAIQVCMLSSEGHTQGTIWVFANYTGPLLDKIQFLSWNLSHDTGLR